MMTDNDKLMAEQEKPLYIVTGSTDSMGSVITRKLAEQGKAVLLASRDIAKAENYATQLRKVTRNKDQIRRDFKLDFTAPDNETMKDIINRLTSVDYRCLIGDCTCSVVNTKNQQKEETTALSVSATATFYETLVGGTVDAGLPADSSKK